MCINSMRQALRCSARSRRSGMQCKGPAVRGKRVCRMHGGKSPGAPLGERNGRYKHGKQTKAAIEARKETRDLIRDIRRLLKEIEA